jgi:hypothetical protein
MPRFLFILLLSFILGGAAPLASAWAGDVNYCIDQCFSTFQPPADCPYCTASRDACVKQCSQVGPSYGAIAHGRSSRAWGSSFQWDSEAKAESVAMQNCQENGDDCEVIVWFHDECGAVAASDGGAAFWGLGDGEGQAREDAVNKCVKGGGKNCEIEAAQCSR